MTAGGHGEVPEIAGRLGRRDAGPGEVPARAGRPRAGGRTGVNPFGDEALALLATGGRPVRACVDRDRAGCDGRAVRRVAALDCGTNTLRLLVADFDAEHGRATYLDRRTTIVRLGQGVDRTGVFAPAALERTFTTLDEYVRGHRTTSRGRGPVRRHLRCPRRQEPRRLRPRCPRPRGGGRGGGGSCQRATTVETRRSSRWSRPPARRSQDTPTVTSADSVIGHHGGRPTETPALAGRRPAEGRRRAPSPRR